MDKLRSYAKRASAQQQTKPSFATLPQTSPLRAALFGMAHATTTQKTVSYSPTPTPATSAQAAVAAEAVAVLPLQARLLVTLSLLLVAVVQLLLLAHLRQFSRRQRITNPMATHLCKSKQLPTRPSTLLHLPPPTLRPHLRPLRLRRQSSLNSKKKL